MHILALLHSFTVNDKTMLDHTARLLSISLLLLAAFANATAQDISSLSKIAHARSDAVTSADPDPNSNADRIKYIIPGETKTLADIKGPEMINHIWLTFNEARPNWLEAGGSAAPDVCAQPPAQDF